MKQLLLLGLLVCIGFTAKPATLAGSATGGGMTLKYVIKTIIFNYLSNNYNFYLI